MTNIVGVRFRNVGKVYYFDPGDLEMSIGDHVIVETSRGIEYGRVVMSPRPLREEETIRPIKEVTRLATPEDDEREQANMKKEREAYKVCVQKIREHELDMKLIDVEYAFDMSKILFYFTADGRVDFRLLVKDLAAVFKTRIELRQIGVRDETKILGGIGICGRGLCCHTYLTDFVPVSIRMAKEQNLSLNQTKISGVCGRLMCCLKNEQETYEELNKKLPSQGDTVQLPDGKVGTVHSVNVLRQLVKVTIETDDEKEIVEYPVDELSMRAHRKKNKAEEKETKESKETKEIKEGKESKESKEQKETKETRDAKAVKAAGEAVPSADEKEKPAEKGKAGRGQEQVKGRRGQDKNRQEKQRGERRNPEKEKPADNQEAAGTRRPPRREPDAKGDAKGEARRSRRRGQGARKETAEKDAGKPDKTK